MTSVQLKRLAARALPMSTDPGLRAYARIIQSFFAGRPVIADPTQLASVSAELMGAAFRARIDLRSPARSHEALFACFDRSIADHVDDPRLGVPLLAESECVSARTVHAVFADRAQTSAAYIRCVRLRRAERLLRTTRLPMVDVALLSGFNDASTLSRVFHRVEGVTPSQFRRETSQSPANP